jgi:hypothetical protein
MTSTLAALPNALESPSLGVAVAIEANLARQDDRGRRYQCIRCGRFEDTDSRIVGACVYCPGFAPLEPS